RSDESAERVGIPGLRPGQEVGSHAAIVLQKREPTTPSGSAPVSAWVKDTNAGATASTDEGT
ncbi:MAG: hypothetical protein ABSB59_39485, partial [Streptosporangiaceae bacterium]